MLDAFYLVSVCVQEAEERIVILSAWRRRAIRYGHGVTMASNLDREFIYLPFNPNQRLLGIDVVEPVNHALATSVEAKIFVLNRPEFSIYELAVAVVRKNYCFSMIFDLRHVNTPIIDAVAQQNILSDSPRSEPVQGVLRDLKLRARIGPAILRPLPVPCASLSVATFAKTAGPAAMMANPSVLFRVDAQAFGVFLTAFVTALGARRLNFGTCGVGGNLNPRFGEGVHPTKPPC